MNYNMEKELLPGLPAYAGGRMAEKVYDAGRGLHATFNDGLPYAQTEQVNNMSRRLLEIHRLALMGCQVTLKDQDQRLEAEENRRNINHVRLSIRDHDLDWHLRPRLRALPLIVELELSL